MDSRENLGIGSNIRNFQLRNKFDNYYCLIFLTEEQTEGDI